jgi:hypothetical protein
MSRHRQKQQKKVPVAKRSEGGKVEQDFYNAEDAPIHKEAETDKESFARGGHKKKRKRGGKAVGRRPRHRADKPRRASGGRTEHSPLTRASEVEGRPGGDYDGKPSSREDD